MANHSANVSKSDPPSKHADAARSAALDREAERDLLGYNENRRRLRSWVRRCRDLSASEKNVIQELIDLANSGDRYAWPSYRWLNRELGVGYTTIANAVRKAEELGVLFVKQVPTPTGTGNLYFLQFDLLGDAALACNVIRLEQPETPGKRSRNGSKGAPETGAYTVVNLNQEEACKESKDDRQPDRGATPSTIGDADRGCPPDINSMTEEEVTKRVNGLISKGFPFLGKELSSVLLDNWADILPAVKEAVQAWRKDMEILEQVIRPLIVELHAAPARSATA